MDNSNGETGDITPPMSGSSMGDSNSQVNNITPPPINGSSIGGSIAQTGNINMVGINLNPKDGSYTDSQQVNSTLAKQSTDFLSQNFSIKQPMCAGGKIQLPKINKKDIITIKNVVEDPAGNIPIINNIGEMSINSIVTDEDLCYNRCPNGEDPTPDFLSGQYTCLIPATVTYQVIPGVNAEVDPNEPNLDNVDKIDYTKGYNVSCQSTDLNPIGLDGQQMGNTNNLMFGIPILKKSGLYEDPLQPYMIRSPDFSIVGNQKWFCKRPVFGSPTINQVQSKYQFISNAVVSHAKPTINSSTINICDIPDWKEGSNIPNGCTVNKMKDGTSSLSVASPYIASITQLQSSKSNASDAESIVNSSNGNNSISVDDIVMKNVSGGLPIVPPNYMSDRVSSKNTQLNIVTNNSVTQVASTDTIAQTVDGVPQIIKPINQSLSSVTSNVQPKSCMPFEPVMWKDNVKDIRPTVITTTTFDGLGICGYQAYYKNSTISVNNSAPIIRKSEIENEVNNLRISKNLKLCREYTNYNENCSISDVSDTKCNSLHFDLLKNMDLDQYNKLDGLCASNPDGNFTF
jgi:hypothetical protein